ncbi:MAG: N-6 DNA methylase [Paludibacteraceae bacterium]|nr:N-6 DNA methylase [Paludibacteraceae bacterium]
MAVNNIVKRMRNIMRQDSGINGDAQRIEQMVWMFFLKVYDTQEENWEFECSKKRVLFESIIPEKLRWRNWAVDNKDGKAYTGDELLNFVNNVVFPVLKGKNAEWKGNSIPGIQITPQTPRSKAVVKEVFEDLNQYMKDGTLLRQIINVVNEIEFDDPEDRHLFGDIYEGILKDLQSAGSAGEFYTPRALTDFIIKMLDPRLGEKLADFTTGTGGFLVSGLRHIKEQIKTADDEELYQQSVIGQEWKPLPYLLAITNLLLNGIDAPNLRHGDSLGRKVQDYGEDEKVDVIAMNPPYGGSTSESCKANFPMAMRSSETADLFMALIMYRLRQNGRAGVIIPDGFLFGTDGAKLAIKTKMLTDFNLHTIIRLPGSIFNPYTSIATNIVFFNKDKAEGSGEQYKTKDVWFYRLDMPEGYKHFSKTKPMKLEHTQPIQDWWSNRVEMQDEDGNFKAKKFTAEELIAMDCNFDQCKFPKEDEEVLPPAELLADYYKKRAALDHEIDKTLAEIQKLLGIKIEK